jgi:hypothetical protein
VLVAVQQPHAQWTFTVNGTLVDLVVGPLSVVVAATTPSSQVEVVSLSLATGLQQWATRVPGTGAALAVDGKGNVLVTAMNRATSYLYVFGSLSFLSLTFRCFWNPVFISGVCFSWFLSFILLSFINQHQHLPAQFVVGLSSAARGRLRFRPREAKARRMAPHTSTEHAHPTHGSGYRSSGSRLTEHAP